MITREELTIEYTAEGLIQVLYVQIDNGIDMGGTLIFHRDNRAAVAAQLLAPNAELQLGPDHFRFYLSGSDQQPIVNAICRHNGTRTGLMLTVPYARKLATLLTTPGYLTEDLELRQIAGPPRYTSRTNGPVEYITLVTAENEPMGIIYASDADNAAGWKPHPKATPTAQNHAAFWMRILHDCCREGRKPSHALDRMLQSSHPASRVVPGSRATAPNLAALDQ